MSSDLQFSNDEQAELNIVENIKRRTVVLHVGIHKTGTTSIQLSLSGYDDGDTIYADLGDPNHSIIFQTIFEKDNFREYWLRLGLSSEEHKRLVDRESKVLQGQLDRGRSRVIFSGENISLMSADVLVRVRDYFDRRSCDVQIIAFVREPLAWTFSAVQECIKHSDFPEDFVRREIPFPSLLRQRMENLIEVFGWHRVSILRYEDATSLGYSGDVVQYFVSHLGLQKSLVSSSYRANKSIGENALKILLAFFQSGVLHNKGQMLERVRWKFIHKLDLVLSEQGDREPDREAFAAFVNWEDYLKLNDLLETPYNIVNHASEKNLLTQFKSYCSCLNEEAVSSALNSAVRDFELGQPDNASVNDLATLLFYGVMRDDAQAQLKIVIEATQQDLEATLQQLQTTQQQLEATQQQLVVTKQQLGTTKQELQTMITTKWWRMRQKLVRMEGAMKQVFGLSR